MGRTRTNNVVAIKVHDSNQRLTESYLNSFQRSLSVSKAPKTVEHYLSATNQFFRFLAETGRPTNPVEVTRADIEEWLLHLAGAYKPSSILNRYKGLQRFWVWLLDEGDIKVNPMARIPQPKVPDTPPPVLDESEIHKLLRACEGKTLADRRDKAILSTLIDTGIRRAEVAGLRWTPDDAETNDVDLNRGVLRVFGKGGRVRFVSIGHETINDIERYLRLRGQHTHAHLPNLWIGARGPITKDGVRQIVEKRARMAGLDRRVYPHLFRHSWAHLMKSSEMSDENIKALGGWRSDVMLRRYGRSAEAERAIAAHKKVSPRDRLGK